MYDDLLEKVTELNEIVNLLRSREDYMGSCHLQEGCITMLDCLRRAGNITYKQEVKLIEALQKRQG